MPDASRIKSIILLGTESFAQPLHVSVQVGYAIPREAPDGLSPSFIIQHIGGIRIPLRIKDFFSQCYVSGALVHESIHILTKDLPFITL